MDLWVKKVKEKVKNKIKSLKKSKQGYNISLVLQDEEVRQYLKDLQLKFCIVPLIKHQITFLLFARYSLFLSC